MTSQPAARNCAILIAGTKYPQWGRPVVAVPDKEERSES